MVGEMAEQPAAERAHQKSGREQQSRIELLHDRIVTGEKRIREVERERRVSVEVIPLDQIAD
jgi:hypothetical protein